jgi:hypothetical protein
MVVKNSAPARRASKSRKSSEPVTLVSPVAPLSGVTNGGEKPVTTPQLAAQLKCSERTIARYRSKRIIPFWRVTAKRIMYRVSDVEACLALRNI